MKAKKVIEAAQKVINNRMELDHLSRLYGTVIFRQYRDNISENEIEHAVSQLLSSYFKFGMIYDFDTFKDLLIQNIAEDIFSGLTDRLKQANTIDNVKYLILNVITIFSKTIKTRKLDGLAWKKDLTPFLKTFIIKFINNLSV